jgi:predicted acyl esterase
VACFSTEPLEEAMDWLGQPLLTLEVAADQPGFDLCAALSVVRRGGRSVQQLSTGVARFRGDACLAPRPRQVRLQPLGARLRRGERLRLSLAAAAWPQIAVNPGTGAAPAGPSGPEHRVITLQFLLGSATLQLIPWDSAKLAPP